MKYPDNLVGYEKLLNATAQLRHELGCGGVEDILKRARNSLDGYIAELNGLAVTENEPELFDDIVTISDNLTATPNIENYYERLKGGIVGRFAGCSLGAPVEFVPTEHMQEVARLTNAPFPPERYWDDGPISYTVRYKVGYARDFFRKNINFVPPDDDIIYTIVSMLVMERYSTDFTVENLAELWLEKLPLECTYTAERAVLNNLQQGMKLPQATLYNNPYINWIGGNIRCDGYGYVSPLRPVQAAKLAYKDAFLTHRNSGLYSAMYFAAAIALAFEKRPLEDILSDALCVVPKNSKFYKVVTDALSVSSMIKDYSDAKKYVDETFCGMSGVHSENNACLTIFGVLLGRDDFAKGIGHTVAMSYDNDCTAATAGSILGVYHGIEGISSDWYSSWNDRVKSYLHDDEWFSIEDMVERFTNISKTF